MKAKLYHCSYLLLYVRTSKCFNVFLTDGFYFSRLTEPEHNLAVSGRTAEPGLG